VHRPFGLTFTDHWQSLHQIIDQLGNIPPVTLTNVPVMAAD
jgi:hypothetical protein